MLWYQTHHPAFPPPQQQTRIVLMARRLPTVRTGADLGRRRLEHFNASLREVAEAARVAPSTVLRWERQEQLPQRPTQALSNILKALNVRKFYERRLVFEGPLEAHRPSRGNPIMCGAKTRSGGSCRKPPLAGKTRCRLHGGLSTGPRTTAGRAKCAEAARNRYRRYL